MDPADRVLVFDSLIVNANPTGAVSLRDITMLVMNDGGRERTLQEYSKLFQLAGLRLTGVAKTESLFCILVAKRA